MDEPALSNVEVGGVAAGCCCDREGVVALIVASRTGSGDAS